MKRLLALSVAGLGGNAIIDRDKIIVPKGKKLAGLRIFITAYIANASGGGIALSATDRANIIDHCLGSFTMKYGRDGERVPYNIVPGSRLRFAERFITGCEMSGYANTTDGLASTIAASATNQAVRYCHSIPFQTPWFLTDAQVGDFAMGATQALDLWCELKRAGTAPTLTANLSLGSNAFTYDILPDLVDAPDGDVWCEVPHYLEKDEVGQTARSPEGLIFGVFDRNATQAATAITEYNLSIGDTKIHENAQPRWVRDLELDTVNFPSGADVADTYTVLYKPRMYDDVKQLPKGIAFVDQPKVDVATIKATYVYVPPISPESAAAALMQVSKRTNRAVKGITVNAYRAKSVPDSHVPFTGMVLKFDDNSHFHNAVGLLATPNGVAPHIPDTLAAQAKGAVAMAKGKGSEREAAYGQRAVSKNISKAIPGAIVKSDVGNHVSGFLRDLFS
jgi:hypothetical protein